eukprot:m.3544 g.3544  ORF g.3544 m.3544 type:complete len:175 (+) comp9523_c0_seq1:62-586(+)
MPSATVHLTLPLVPLQVFLLIHFFLFIFGNITYYGGGDPGSWMPSGYEFSNSFLLGSGIWVVIEAQSAGPALFFFFVVLINILHEIVFFAIYFPRASDIAPGDPRRTWQFSAAMAVINHIVKYFTLLVAFQVFSSRGGRMRETFSRFRSEYEPIRGSVTTDEDNRDGGGSASDT